MMLIVDQYRSLTSWRSTSHHRWLTPAVQWSLSHSLNTQLVVA